MAITNSAGVVVHIDSPNSPGADDSRSVHLVRDNTLNYGEVSNQNFYRVTENFAGDAAPGLSGSFVTGTPLQGQFWYHKSQKNLRILVEDDNSLNNWKSIVKEGDSTELNELTTRGDTTLGTDSSEAVTIRGTTRITAPTTIVGDLVLVNASNDNKSDLTVPGNLILEGDLQLTGKIDTKDVSVLNVEDRTITLNAGTTGTPSSNADASIIVERGNLTNAELQWDETGDNITSKWKIKNIRTNAFHEILTKENGTILENNIANNAVTTAKINNSAVTNEKLVVVSIEKGGTNANDAPTARSNLGVAAHLIQHTGHSHALWKDDTDYVLWNEGDTTELTRDRGIRVRTNYGTNADYAHLFLRASDGQWCIDNDTTVSGKGGTNNQQVILHTGSVVALENGGTGNASTDLDDLKTHLDILTAVNTSTSRTTPSTVFEDSVTQDHNHIPRNNVGPYVVQLLDHGEVALNTLAFRPNSDSNDGSWTEKTFSLPSGANTIITDVRVMLKCTSSTGDRGFSEGELTDPFVFLGLDNGYGDGNPGDFGEEFHYAPIRYRINQSDSKIYFQRSEYISYRIKVHDDKGPVSFSDAQIDQSKWKVVYSVFGSVY